MKDIYKYLFYLVMGIVLGFYIHAKFVCEGTVIKGKVKVKGSKDVYLEQKQHKER